MCVPFEAICNLLWCGAWFHLLQSFSRNRVHVQNTYKLQAFINVFWLGSTLVPLGSTSPSMHMPCANGVLMGTTLRTPLISGVRNSGTHCFHMYCCIFRTLPRNFVFCLKRLCVKPRAAQSSPEQLMAAQSSQGQPRAARLAWVPRAPL